MGIFKVPILHGKLFFMFVNQMVAVLCECWCECDRV